MPKFKRVTQENFEEFRHKVLQCIAIEKQGVFRHPWIEVLWVSSNTAERKFFLMRSDLSIAGQKEGYDSVFELAGDSSDYEIYAVIAGHALPEFIALDPKTQDDE